MYVSSTQDVLQFVYPSVGRSVGLSVHCAPSHGYVHSMAGAEWAYRSTLHKPPPDNAHAGSSLRQSAAWLPAGSASHILILVPPRYPICYGSRAREIAYAGSTVRLPLCTRPFQHPSRKDKPEPLCCQCEPWETLVVRWVGTVAPPLHRYQNPTSPGPLGLPGVPQHQTITNKESHRRHYASSPSTKPYLGSCLVGS